MKTIERDYRALQREHRALQIQYDALSRDWHLHREVEAQWRRLFRVCVYLLIAAGIIGPLTVVTGWA